MQVLSHRGLWSAPEERNTEAAFLRSFAAGFGTETDVRDCRGDLVISHDPAVGGEMTLERFLSLLDGRRLPLALNIKADGLAERVREAMRHQTGVPWFVFDMSVPDMRHHLRAGNPVYARLSEVEPQPPWPNCVVGIWLDGFEDRWWDASTVEALLGQNRDVCVVSPELHGRDPHPAWACLKPLSGSPRLSICTDRPHEARRFFDEVTR